MLKDPVETATPCAPIHDRLPMILQPADYARCAGEEEVSLRGAEGAPAACACGDDEAFLVGAAVGSVENNSATLIEPTIV
jgi:hypothetical protein